MLFVSESGTFARCAARHKKINPCVDLALDERPQRPFIKRTIRAKWSDERSACTGKHGVSPSLSKRRTAEQSNGRLLSSARCFAEGQCLNSDQLNSPKISLNSKNPFFPATHRAACNAPRANPSRLRA